MLRVCIDTPDSIRPKVERALEVLAEGVGLPLALVESNEANTCYSATKPQDPDVIWLPAAHSGWTDTTPAVTLWAGTPFIGEQPAIAATNGIAGDICIGTWLMITGAFEATQERNRFGVPVGTGSLASETGLLSQPLVARYVALLSEALYSKWGSRFRPVPRWPNGCTKAIALSHDVDRPLSRPTALHYRQRIARDLRRLRLFRAGRGAAGYVRNVVLLGDASLQTATDPNFGFRGWRQFESQIGARSAFYVAVRHSAEADATPEEVNYHFDQPAILNELKLAADAGWEIGLHASIACRSQPTRFVLERQRLEVALGHPISGLRHHYWALDATRPEVTLEAHAQAGFRYDSSLGFNDMPGFRRGMAWPFNPVNPDTAQRIATLQVPPTIMDGAIFYRNPTPDEGEAELRAHMEAAFASGGAAVLNWHVAQMNPVRLGGAGPALMRVLSEYADDSSIYWGRPIDIADWWIVRRERIANTAR